MAFSKHGDDGVRFSLHSSERRNMIQFLIKAMSGRYVLTVTCAIVFAYCAIQGKMSNEAIAAILGTVFTAYFNRQDRGNTQGGQQK